MIIFYIRNYKLYKNKRGTEEENTRKKLIGIGVFVLIVGIVVTVCSLVIVPFTTTKSVQVPKTYDIIKESFSVPALSYKGYSGPLKSGDTLHIYVKVTSGGNLDIDFYVMDEINYYKWKAGESASAPITRPRITTYDSDWAVSQTATWYFIFDNRFSLLTSKGVTAQITKHWTETESKQVTEYHPLIPSEYSYVGTVLFLGGIAAIIGGVISRLPTKPSPAA
jgi:hypothetical protein